MADDFRFKKLGDTKQYARAPTIYFSSEDGDKLVVDAVLVSAAQIDHLIRVLQANRAIFSSSADRVRDR
ncbi:MAG: hypothetical protein QM813_17065 [Verrucomicrobiota bacterium]